MAKERRVYRMASSSAMECSYPRIVLIFPSVVEQSAAYAIKCSIAYMRIVAWFIIVIAFRIDGNECIVHVGLPHKCTSVIDIMRNRPCRRRRIGSIGSCVPTIVVVV